MKNWNFFDYISRYQIITDVSKLRNLLKKNFESLETKEIKLISYNKKLIKSPLKEEIWQRVELNKKDKSSINQLRKFVFERGNFIESITACKRKNFFGEVCIEYKLDLFDYLGKKMGIGTNLKIYSIQKEKEIIADFSKEHFLESIEPGVNIGAEIRELLKPALPIESVAFNEYMRYVSRKNIKTEFTNEFENLELELKFSNEDSLAHKKIYDFFKERQGNFILERNFDFFLYRNLIVGYLNHLEKFILMFNSAPIRIKKDKSSLIPLGEGFLILRKEIKKKAKYSSLKLVKKENILVKRKRVFWIENILSKRIYHIAIDLEMNSRGSFSQVEIEYAGRISNKKSKNIEEIKKDLEDLSVILKSKFRFLSHSTKTKAQWLIKR